jgi:hypothetical protein
VTRRGSHIFEDNRLTDGGKFVSLLRQEPITPEDSWYSFLLETESTPVGLEGLSQLKNPMTSSKIKPATFRLVA